MVGHGFRLLEEDWVGGPAWSVCSQLGEKGFPPTNPGFIFIGKLGSVSVWTCEIILSRCIYTYDHSWNGAILHGKKLDLTPAHLRATAPDLQHDSVCTFLSTFVYFFLWQLCNPWSLLLEGDQGDRRLPGTRWYGCDTREPLSNTGSRCHDDEKIDHGAMRANASHSGIRHYQARFPLYFGNYVVHSLSYLNQITFVATLAIFKDFSTLQHYLSSLPALIALS